MIAPPTNSHLGRHTRDCDMWVEYQHMQSQLDPQEIVEDCEEMYGDAYGSVSKRERDGLVLSDIQQDLAKMSNQPAIRYVYRRFVIIKSDVDVHGRPGEEDWVSCRGAARDIRAANPCVPSASGSWFRDSRLATKLIPRISCGVYDRRIMRTMAHARGAPFLLEPEWARVVTRAGHMPNSISPVVQNNGPHSLERCSHPRPFPRQALRRPNNHRHSFEPWPTDCKPSSRIHNTPPLPQLHHPPTTRPTTMIHSTSMLHILPRTQVIKPSPSNPRLSPTPQRPSTVAPHRSLSTTRAGPPFHTNPRARVLGCQ